MNNVDINKINPLKVINFLIKNLNEREKIVLLHRYGLKGDQKKTLDQIGKTYKITRERVRQIEKNSIHKLKNLDGITKEKSKLPYLQEYIHNILKKHGGLTEEAYLLDYLQHLNPRNDNDIFNKVILFLLDFLIADVKKLEETQIRNAGWKLTHIDNSLIDEIVSVIVEIVQKANTPLSDKEILHQFLQTETYLANQEKIMALCDLNKDGLLTISEIFTSYLMLSKNVKKNIFDKWGLNTWDNVVPKKINDKAYLVLLKAGKPLHFTEITNLINKAGFDNKVACPATVHNELILNDQYVLVGRGIYALKEWGYDKGTVVDVIYNILKDAAKALSKEEIVQEVLKKRIVKKSTIYLSLLNKNKFEKIAHNLYKIKN